MPEGLVQQYGPLLQHVHELGDYLRFSEQAFILGSEVGGNRADDWGTLEGRVLQLLGLHALNTSYSVRLLTTYAQPIEAYALLRVRLEQVILCSYLIHAEPEKGIIPYTQDFGRVNYRSFQSLDQDPELRDLLTELMPWTIEDAKAQATQNERLIDPDFDLDKDKLKRKWTNLSLYDMALYRDKIVPQDEPPMSIKLTRFYLGLYKPASIIVHSDTGSLTENFLTLNPTKAGGKQLGPHIAYIFLNLINVAHLDLIQSYEVLHYLRKPEKRRIADLYARFKEHLAKDLGIDLET